MKIKSVKHHGPSGCPGNHSNDMVIGSRAWCVEAAWGQQEGPAYARELVDLLHWGMERGINGVDMLHGERGGYADPGGIVLEEEAIRLRVPFTLGGHVRHGFPPWAPESMFERRPDLFRMDAGGKRTPTGNFCTANQEALGRAVGELTKLLDRHPRARLIQAFPDDVLGGSWCHCPRCRGRSPADQYATLISAAAGALDARMPGMEMGFLLYHDTLAGLPDKPVGADGSRFVPPNVYALYAPRERCYAHAIDDDTCPRNRFYWQSALRAREAFEGRVDVFEYYGDTVLWRGFNVAIPHVIAADLRAYQRLGVREVQALVFGTCSLWAHGLNLAVFACLSSGLESDTDAAIARHARERFGRKIERRMVEYYLALEKAQSLYLGFCHYEDEWMHDLRSFFAPSRGYAEHRQRAARCAEPFRELAEMLSQASDHCEGGPFLANLKAEQASLEIARIELEKLELRLAIADERIVTEGTDVWTEEDTARQSAAQRRQWEIAKTVPVEIRGRIFVGLAPSEQHRENQAGNCPN